MQILHMEKNSPKIFDCFQLYLCVKLLVLFLHNHDVNIIQTTDIVRVHRIRR